MRRLLVLFCATVAIVSSLSRADVRLPSVISDGVVLQRERAVPIWGWADAGERVTVEIGGQKHQTNADGDGAWRVTVRPTPAGGPHVLVIDGAGAKREINDVWFGEVWICGGQSNMEWPLSRSSTADAEVGASPDPMLRLFKVEHAAADSPQADCKGAWAASTPQSRAAFSGVAHHFGKILRKQLNVPVGLVQPTWGGTPAEAWMSDAALRDGDRFVGLFTRIESWKQVAPQEQAAYEKLLQAWEQERATARGEGKAAPKKPAQPKSTRPQLYPSKLYNGMIAPLAPFAARGVIWYQGEANADRAHQYRTMLPALIADWRRAFENADMPFGIVQLANYGPAYHKPVEPSVWSELRDAQLQTAREVRNAGLIVTIDIGEAGDIHPKNKAEVGRRLSLWALSTAYGRDVPSFSGPAYRGHDIAGDAVRIRFDHADGGLRANDDTGELAGFAIAGEDREFHPAVASIDGDVVVVRSSSVARPVAVRYAWSKNPACNLTNAAGLPASPFRTDDWPDKTAEQE